MNDLRTDDLPVENALREILEPLDRQLARVSMFLPLALVTIVPAVFFILWLGFDMTGRRALVMSGGSCCALVAFYLTWEILVCRVALRRFDRCFPPGSAGRTAALKMLVEMVTPSRAEEKLRVALASSSPDRIIRQRPTEKPPAMDTVSLDAPGTPGEADTNVIHLAERTPLLPGRRPGGYYDYIPLEPRSAEQDRPTSGEG